MISFTSNLFSHSQTLSSEVCLIYFCLIWYHSGMTCIGRWRRMRPFLALGPIDPASWRLSDKVVILEHNHPPNLLICCGCVCVCVYVWYVGVREDIMSSLSGVYITLKAAGNMCSVRYLHSAHKIKAPWPCNAKLFIVGETLHGSFNSLRCHFSQKSHLTLTCCAQLLGWFTYHGNITLFKVELEWLVECSLIQHSNIFL